ncbi:hypothetical protein DRE_00834 [Drechslerella stenobrocha 248]|uniref:Peptidase S33 tripeptidyl aminopeptidase-like C-terminal domain-containing protein n=1 Tax=Drechslerella stenobrocha 248 TaxID=1043628 RepID=W7I8R9_9PEZI|nr:hypothetical protein DRE_00834 [Drechslerella stenobrocha 248]
MIGSSAVLLALLASADAFYTVKRQVAREFLFQGIPPSREIRWYPCNETQEVYMECARLDVPLDYKNTSNNLRAIIPIVKFPTNATGEDYKGAVLTNPGGPGYLGTEFVYNPTIAKGIVANVTGTGYDILGFDIRGVGYSIPYGACNVTAEDVFDPLRQNATRDGYRNTKRNAGGYAKHGGGPPGALDTETAYGFYIPQVAESALTQILDYAQNIDTLCQAYVGAENQAGPYMNTAVTATDMLSIAKALARSRGDNSTNPLVHFYGVSYGTVLGQTFATMYPKNVGKFVLDGVVDMDGWQARTETNTNRNADEGLFQFFKRCYEAGPEECAFANGTCNYQDVINRFNRMTLRFNGTQYQGEERIYAELLNTLASGLKSVLLNGLYSAIHTWKNTGIILTALDVATSGPIVLWNATAIAEILAYPLTDRSDRSERPVAPLQHRPYSFYQVACGDALSIYNATISSAEQQLYLGSSVVGGDGRLGDRYVCTRFSTRPKWEWHERIGGATKTPILFVGNTLDPVTPWDDAVKASVKFKGAGVVIVDAIAHAFFDQENNCVQTKVRDYFQNGTMPGNDYKCAEERRPFT